MTWDELLAIGLTYPGVEEGVSYGEPSLKVRRSLLTRWRRPDNSLVLMDVDHFERDHLLESAPDVYFLEPHYENYEIVLARMDQLAAAEATMFLERRWRNVAPKKLIKEWDAK